MTARKKRKPSADISDLGLGEALARLLQTSRAELADVVEQVDREDKQVSDYVEERRKSIKKGARRTGSRFRL
jgi:hypothetical protein